MTPEQEIKLLKELLCTKRSCNNCGKVNCENFQRQRIDCCGLWVSYKDYITELENKIADIKANCDLAIEGRDVKIMELEQKNAELKEKLKENLKTIADKDLSFVAKFDALERENAELKEKLNFSTQYYQGEKAKDQLTKAIEIISAFVEWANWQGGNCPNFKSIQDKAEQFLKEIEK